MLEKPEVKNPKYSGLIFQDGKVNQDFLNFFHILNPGLGDYEEVEIYFHSKKSGSPKKNR